MVAQCKLRLTLALAQAPKQATRFDVGLVDSAYADLHKRAALTSADPKRLREALAAKEQKEQFMTEGSIYPKGNAKKRQRLQRSL